MFNRYFSAAWPEKTEIEATFADQSLSDFPENQSFQTNFSEVADEQHDPKRDQTKNQSILKGLFGGNIKLPEFDADTILLLVLVYFLVADDTENISDTLLIIGVLLLLGF